LKSGRAHLLETSRKGREARRGGGKFGLWDEAASVSGVGRNDALTRNLSLLVRGGKRLERRVSSGNVISPSAVSLAAERGDRDFKGRGVLRKVVGEKAFVHLDLRESRYEPSYGLEVLVRGESVSLPNQREGKKIVTTPH